MLEQCAKAYDMNYIIKKDRPKGFFLDILNTTHFGLPF